MKIDDYFDEMEEIDMVEMEQNLSPEKQLKLEKLVMDKIRRERNEDVWKEKQQVTKDKSEWGHYRGRKKRKTTIRIILVAVLLLGMTAYGAERNEWDLAIMNYMGIHGTNTELLEGGQVGIDASDSDGGLTMGAVTSVGDKNSVYIRVDTDYIFGDSFDPEKDYILPENYQIEIDNTGFGQKSVSGYATTMEYFNNKGKLSFMILISNCEEINRKKVTIKLDNLYLYHDLQGDMAEKEKIAQGTWCLSWQYAYPSNVESYHPFEKVMIHEASCLITKVEISPISIRVQGVKNPKNGRQVTVIGVEKIIMKDGSVIVFDPDSSSGGCRDNMFLEGYRDVLEMTQVIDPKMVKSIVIGGEEVKLGW